MDLSERLTFVIIGTFFFIMTYIAWNSYTDIGNFVGVLTIIIGLLFLLLAFGS